MLQNVVKRLTFSGVIGVVERNTFEESFVGVFGQLTHQLVCQWTTGSDVAWWMQRYANDADNANEIFNLGQKLWGCFAH